MAVLDFECQIARGQIKRFLQGEAPSTDAARMLNEHIERCPSCEEVVRDRRADLVALLGASHAVDDDVQEGLDSLQPAEAPWLTSANPIADMEEPDAVEELEPSTVASHAYLEPAPWQPRPQPLLAEPDVAPQNFDEPAPWEAKAPILEEPEPKPFHVEPAPWEEKVAVAEELEPAPFHAEPVAEDKTSATVNEAAAEVITPALHVDHPHKATVVLEVTTESDSLRVTRVTCQTVNQDSEEIVVSSPQPMADTMLRAVSMPTGADLPEPARTKALAQQTAPLAAHMRGDSRAEYVSPRQSTWKLLIVGAVAVAVLIGMAFVSKGNSAYWARQAAGLLPKSTAAAKSQPASQRKPPAKLAAPSVAVKPPATTSTSDAPASPVATRSETETRSTSETKKPRRRPRRTTSHAATAKPQPKPAPTQSSIRVYDENGDPIN